MNQRTTGLVVGLVIFVILTVGLLASTIYFNIEAGDAKAKAKDANDVAASAKKGENSARDAFQKLAGFVTGDPNLSPNGEEAVTQVKKALDAEGVANLKTELETLRSTRDQLTQDNANLKKAADSARAEAALRSGDLALLRADAFEKVRAGTTTLDEALQTTRG